MIKVKEDLTRKVFGRLTVIEQAEDHIQINGRCKAQYLFEKYNIFDNKEGKSEND